MWSFLRSTRILEIVFHFNCCSHFFNMSIPSFSKLFKPLNLNLWLIGIPYGENKLTVRFFLLFLSLASSVTAEICYLVSKISVENLVEITLLAPATCIGILSMLKILTIVSKRSKIYQLTESFYHLYKGIERDDEKASLLYTDMTMLQRLVKYVFILNFALISFYNVSTVLLMLIHYIKYNDVVFLLTFAMVLPFEVNGWLSWGMVYLKTFISSYTCVLYFTTTDALYYFLTSQTCSNFTIISKKINKISKHNTAILQEIVREHQYILKLAGDLEDIFTVPNLLNVLVGSIEICALGFNLTTTSDLRQVPAAIWFLTSVLVQILMMSVFGENLMTKSGQVGAAAYETNWYELDTKSKKTILIILLRSVKPQTLTAYKFSTIGYGSFSKIISTSWSYFTILKTVYSPPSGKT